MLQRKKKTPVLSLKTEIMTFICTADLYHISELHACTTSLILNLLFVFWRPEILRPFKVRLRHSQPSQGVSSRCMPLCPRQSKRHKGASVLLAFASQTITFVCERKACVSKSSGITQGRARTAAITIILDSIIVCLMGHPGPGAAIKL